VQSDSLLAGEKTDQYWSLVRPVLLRAMTSTASYWWPVLVRSLTSTGRNSLSPTASVA